jgi:acetyl-CoA C-acetyltransferase
MPEAVIVSVARSPIGRAVKGSLASMRPDDLASQVVSAVLDKVPALDPREIDDLMLGCAQPGRGRLQHRPRRGRRTGL